MIYVIRREMSAWRGTELVQASTERDFQSPAQGVWSELAGDKLEGGVNTPAFAAAYIPLLRSRLHRDRQLMITALESWTRIRL